MKIMVTDKVRHKELIMKKEIYIYFDFTSPYSYLAIERIFKLKDRYKNKINCIFMPILVGKLINDIGGIGPASISVKRDYLFKDCQKKANLRNIKFCSPKRMPFNPLFQLRMAASLNEHELQSNFIVETFRYGWGEGYDYEDYENFKSYILKKVKITKRFYKELEDDVLSRKILKKNIECAKNHGLFGVPSFTIEKEFFWGDDSIEEVEMLLNGCSLYNEKMNDEYQNFLNIFN